MASCRTMITEHRESATAEKLLRVFHQEQQTQFSQMGRYLGSCHRFLLYVIWFSVTVAETQHQVVCDIDTELECSPGVCIDLQYRCDGIPDCENGHDESTLVCGCPSHEFQCNETTCIDLIRRCDWSMDCPDGSDEDNCETFQCLHTHSKCQNTHKCIPRDKTCDFIDDCGDKSDEEDCYRRPCYAYGEFRCENEQCISSYIVCDGINDCLDGSDEVQCQQEDFVTCSDGTQIHRHQWCDGITDCKESHDDEINCYCAEDDFRCGNGRCISRAYLCDLSCDCAGTCEDEKNCSSGLCTLENHFWCDEFSRCLHKDTICDGKFDCFDWSDEYGCGDDFNCSTHEYENQIEFFRCGSVESDDGRCIPERAVCDYQRHCILGTDESDERCGHPACMEDEFQCNNGHVKCIPIVQRCDTNPDCLDGSDERNCEDYLCDEGQLQCNESGQCIHRDMLCNFIKNCADNSDEENCGHVIRNCTEDEFQCRNGQCIDLSRRCYFDELDDVYGCKDKSHLIGCNDFECSADTLKCRNGHCVSQSLVCNGNIDCGLIWTDEEGCSHICSNLVCMCQDDEMNCEDKNLHEIPYFIEPGYIKLKLGHNYLGEDPNLSNYTFAKLGRLTYLGLEDNNITDLKSFTFSNLWRLLTLNLEDNFLSTLRRDTFDGLGNVRSLYLQGNSIGEIEAHAFKGLSALPTLDLHGQRLQWLHINAFAGLSRLLSLNLSHNQIQYIDNGVFNGLSKLLVLDISNNVVIEIDSKVFYGLMELTELYTDEYRFCCMAKFVQKCHPPPDQFSSCQDLMSNVVLRGGIWLLGVIASVGNLVVVCFRLRDRRDNKVHSFLITNLAVGDLCMGVYLIIIAVADTYYRGNYIIHDKVWRQSQFCKIAGFLSTFSSELSVFTLTVITVDRLVCIVFPFRFNRLEFKGAARLMAALWLIVFFISAVPLFGLSYFTDYYGRSGVCLALHITNERPDGWEYSVFVFLIINLVNFLIILLSYIAMFIVASKTQQAVRNRDLKTESAMAKRITVIVMSDFFCWVPIILLGLASLGGAVIPPQVYAWIAVFVLPLNSALNPVLYTLSTPTFVKRTKKMADSIGESFRSRWRTDGRTNSFTVSESQARSSFSYTGIDRLDRCASVASSNSATVAIRLRSFSGGHNGGADLTGCHDKRTGSDPSTRERCDSGKSVTFASDSRTWLRRALQAPPKEIKIVEKFRENKFKIEFKPEEQSVGAMIIGFLELFSEAQEKHFTRLRDMLKKLSSNDTAHENIIRMLWSGSVSDLLSGQAITEQFPGEFKWCICVEYIEGVTLKTFAKDKIDTRELSRIVIQIAKALDHLRKHKIVYNNLSTSSIIIQRIGQESSRKVRPILFDFAKPSTCL
ncbi:G-protein coupled receptor GRL101-like [Ptychodera flava]|uniref:G-protein coupled receptor GRL101-like n=1 Tax=Ptychodera flava TaxID=63121 RepID=UPI003969FFC4